MNYKEVIEYVIERFQEYGHDESEILGIITQLKSGFDQHSDEQVRAVVETYFRKKRN